MAQDQGRKQTATPKKTLGPRGMTAVPLPPAPVKPASSTMVKLGAPLPAYKPAAPAPAPAARVPAPVSYGSDARISGQVGGGGGVSTPGSADLSAQAAPAPEPISEEDYLAGDSGYQATLAALLRALSDSGADATAQRTKYDTDYGQGLKSLGWTQDDPATADVNEGAWNFNDLNTAAGRSFNNQQNDFAGRGLLQSSLYATANDNLTRSLNDQLSGVNTAKQGFMDDLSRQQSQFKNENTGNQQQARAEALARRASGIALA